MFASQYDNGDSWTSKTIDLANWQQQLITIDDDTTLTIDASSLSWPWVFMLEILMDWTWWYSLSFSWIEFEDWAVGEIDNTANANTYMSINYDWTTISWKLVNNKDFS